MNVPHATAMSTDAMTKTGDHPMFSATYPSAGAATTGPTVEAALYTAMAVPPRLGSRLWTCTIPKPNVAVTTIA